MSARSRINWRSVPSSSSGCPWAAQRHRYTASHPAKVERLVIVDIGPDIARRAAERVSDRRRGAEEFASVEDAMAYLRQQAVFMSPAAEGAASSSRTRREEAAEPATWKYDKFLRDQRRQGGSRPSTCGRPSGRSRSTLIVRGSESDVFSPETAKRMPSSCPSAASSRFPAPDLVPPTRPGRSEQAVRGFWGLSATCPEGLAMRRPGYVLETGTIV
jgi:pimeloyl-ACP methyl ester carboxylesterase